MARSESISNGHERLRAAGLIGQPDIDPERDTPQALAALAKQRRMDLTRWRGDADRVPGRGVRAESPVSLGLVLS